jgi:RsiW-degrading membrane proteinase PrsW (M82 family)
MANKIPNGLVFSSKSPSRKKRTFILVPILVIIQLCLIWPIYPIMASAKPLILGIPLSFFWVILMVCFSFISLLIFFRKDADNDEVE